MAELSLPHPADGPRTNHRRLGTVMVLLAATLFAVNASVSKLALQASDLGTLRWTELRSTAAFACLAVWLLLRRPGALRLDRKDIVRYAIYGVLGFLCIQWLYFVAIERLPIGVALIFEFSGVVLIALWVQLVWRQPVRARIWPALALVLGGLALVSRVWAGATLDTVGVLAACGAAVSLALFYLQGERLLVNRDAVAVTCLGLAFASLTWVIIQPWWGFPFEALTVETDLPGALGVVPVWGLAVYTVLLGTVAPFLLSIGALRYLSATGVGIVATSEPVLASIVAWVWLGESLLAVQFVGGLIVLCGIVLAETAR